MNQTYFQWYEFDENVVRSSSSSIGSGLSSNTAVATSSSFASEPFIGNLNHTNA